MLPSDFRKQYKTQISGVIFALRKHWMLWVIPTLLCTLAAAWFALKPRPWQASQSLVVRDDMIGDAYKPGRFESLDSMKTAQETILHIAREPMVVRRALETVGPPARASKNWLEGDNGIEAVESTQESISIVAPNGAEFGMTEVIVLQVKSKEKERARQLTTALLDEIEAQLRKMRAQRLVSMQTELDQALKQAQEDYDRFASKLETLEQEIGPDLPTLLTMINDANSSNDLQIALENIRGAKRTAHAELDLTTKQLEMLRATADNPEALVATSSELLTAQPALSRLKDGLVDAQLKLSEDLGRYEEAHPAIQKGRFSVSETKRQIRQELETAIQGLESQKDVRMQNLKRLNKEEQQFEQRLVRLANNRVRYDSLASQAKKRNEELAKTRAEYAEIKSLGRAAETVNLMTRVDKPFVSGKPLGPGKTTILGSGLIGGLMLGLGILMFFSGPGGAIPVIQPPGTRPDGNAANTQRPSSVRPSQSSASLPRTSARTDSTPSGANALRAVGTNQVPQTPITTAPPPNTSSGQRPAATRPIQAVKQLEPSAPPLPTTSPSTPVRPQPFAQALPDKSQDIQFPPSAQAIDLGQLKSEIAATKQNVSHSKNVSHGASSQNPSSIPKAKSVAPNAQPSTPKVDQQLSPEAKLAFDELPPLTLPHSTASTTQPQSTDTSPPAQQQVKPPTRSAPMQTIELPSPADEPKQPGPIDSSSQPPVTPKSPSADTISPGSNSTLVLPTEPKPKQTIDINALRSELGSEPIDSHSAVVDLNDVKRRLIETATAPETPSATAPELPSSQPPEDLESLHERIKRLTDPNKSARNPINPDQDANA